MANNISGTGGAIPVKNEKGEISMKKVKVHRYIAGKRPVYAPTESDEEAENYEEENEEEQNSSDDDNENVKSWLKNNEKAETSAEKLEIEANDRRVRRLQERDRTEAIYEQKERLARHRRIMEPEVLVDEPERTDDRMDLDDEENEKSREKEESEKSDEEEEAELDEEDRLKHRQLLKLKVLEKQEEEMLVVEEEQKAVESDKSEEESEYEEDDESEEESEDEVAPRLKPVFVRKRDRATVQEKELESQRLKQIEAENHRLHEEARKHTKKIIEDEIRKERMAEKEAEDNIKCDFETDGENDEDDYEAWKLRELKRIKRDRDEKESREREKEEINRLRNMTDEERKAEFRANPKVITNLKKKGEYKFLQKYYHRGAFFMHEDQEIFKRDFDQPTLEDHFDKTTLPKVMQVKNFGMSGRTKYTHLLDQDTTKADDNPWTAQEKFSSKMGGGRQVFDRPAVKKRKN